MQIEWDNIVIAGISGIKIDMTMEAKVSIFKDNDLMHINDDHCTYLLNQICVVYFICHHQDMITLMIHMLM